MKLSKELKRAVSQSAGLPTFEELRPQFLKVPLHLWVPDGLEDFQVGWFFNLLRGSLRSELLGYLPLCAQRDCKNCPSCPWRVAGARHQDYFARNGPVVIAAFEPSRIAGRRVLYFPPLIRCLIEQQKHMRAKNSNSKSVTSGDLFSETCDRFPQIGRRSSYSSSHSSSEVKREKEPDAKKPALSEKLRERFERERRSRLTQATEHGLRDYRKYPLEDWEKTG